MSNQVNRKIMNFLSCEWRKLAIANYAIDPAILRQHLPHKTELDLRNGICYVSLVGFMFLDTKMLGMRIPRHVNFEEVNLRFYVRHQGKSGDLKRGVVFIKEIVPKPILAFTGRVLYKENYQALPMKHQWTLFGTSLEVEYAWKLNQWNTMLVKAVEVTEKIKTGSDEEFIFEHYWGYTRVNDKKTYEYKVEHPRWHVYPVRDYAIDVEFGELYGKEFAFLKNEKPVSVFLAEGSDVKVKSKRTL